MALPPNLVIFNSNKKMVQLSKVVSNLQFTLDTCLYQISSFEDRFSKEFQEIFNSHKLTISKATEEITSHKEKIVSENQKMYSHNYEKMKEQYNQTISSLFDSMNSEAKNFLNEIEKLKKEIPDIIIKINSLTSSVTEPLSDIFSGATKETIPILKAKFQEELKLHDEESERKFNELKVQMSKRIESYETSYSNEKDNLKKEFFETDDAFDKVLIELEEKLKVFHHEIDQLKETFLNMQKNHKNLLNDIKQKCLNESDGYQKEFNDYNQKLFEINSQLESLEFDNSDEIKTILEKIKLFKEKHLDEMTELQSQFAQLLLSHKVEVENQNSLQKTNESSSDEQYNNLKNQLQNEFNQVKDENEKNHLELTETIKNLKNQLDDLLKSFQTEINEKSTNYNSLKEKKSKEVIKLKEEQDDELHLEYANFESKMSVLVKKLGQNKTIINNSKIAEETKNELTKELNVLMNEIKKSKGEFELSYQKEKEALFNQNEISLKTFQEEEEEKYLKIKANLEGQITENNQKFEEAKKSLISSLKSEHENKLSQIPKRFRDDNVIPSLVQNFQSQYKSLQKVLNDQPTEIVHETNEKELDEIIHEKENLISRIEKEKAQLLSKMKSNEEDEQKRHNFALSSLVPSHKEGEIDELRDKCKKRINDLVQRQDDLLFSLRKLKEQNQNQNTVSVSGYLDDEEVIKLRKFLEALRNDLKNQRRDKQIDLEESIAKKNEEIELTIQKIKEEIEKKIAMIENEKIEHKQRIEEVNEEAKVRMEEVQMQFETEKDSFKECYEKVKFLINEKVRKLREKYKNEKFFFNKTKDELKIDAEKNLINNHMQITQTFEKLNAEINSLKNKREEFEKQSKIQIEEIRKNSMKKAENIPMRLEESIEIKRLEDILEQKTQQLTVVAKDLMGYKSRLKQQEDEYNRRFGVAPQVAVLNNGDNRRQTKSAAFVKKPLPPLKNSVC